jgi:hypothetical protein
VHFFTLRAAFFAFDIPPTACRTPSLRLVAGFALQFAGAVLLLLDVHLLVAAI